MLRRRISGEVEEVVYPTGLTAAFRPGSRLPAATVRCFVRGGSIAEGLPGGRGIAHLLEHLIATAAAAEMEQQADGALLNAFTTHDQTCYHWSVLEEDVASSLRAFFAGLRRVRSLGIDLAAEKEVVLQEIDLFREKQLALFQQFFLEEMFDVHPLRYPVCGYSPVVAEVSEGDLAAYVSRIYTAPNLRFEIEGAFDEREAAETIGETALPMGQRFDLHVGEPPRSSARLFSMESSNGRAVSQIGLRILGDDGAALQALTKNIDQLRAKIGSPVEARSAATAFHAGYFNVLVQDGEETVRQWFDETLQRSCDADLTIGRLVSWRAAKTARSPLPAETIETLANGVRVVTIPEAAAACHLLSLGGLLAETEETNGVCRLMANLLPHKRRGLSAFGDENFVGVSVMGDDVERLAAMTIAPPFDRDVVEKERRETVDWLVRAPKTWLIDVQLQLKQLLYRVHPYRLHEGGTPESLAQITFDDVVDCHRRTVVGSNTVIVATGNVAALKIFETIPSGTFTPRTVAEGTAEPGTRVITRPSAIGALAVGYRGVGFDPDTWFALELIKALLVGPENNSVRGSLMRAMREDGASYNVHCLSEAGYREGYFAIIAAYAPEREEGALEIVTKEIDRLRDGSISAAALKHCRKLHLLQQLRRHETPRALAYGIGRELLLASRRVSRESIDVDEIAAVARKVFDPARRGVVLLRPEGSK